MNTHVIRLEKLEDLLRAQYGEGTIFQVKNLDLYHTAIITGGHVVLLGAVSKKQTKKYVSLDKQGNLVESDTPQIGYMPVVQVEATSWREALTELADM